MELEEIKNFMEQNKDSAEVKDLRKSFMPKFDDLLEDESFNKAISSYTDSKVSKGVETFKNEKFTLAVEEETKKRVEAMNNKTPEQIKFEEYEKKLTDMSNKLQAKERDELISKNKTEALKSLSDKKLPSDLLDFLVSDETEKTNKNIETFSSMMENYTTNLKQEFMSSNNTKVPGKQEVVTKPDNMPGDGASKAEWEAYYKKKYSN